MSDILHLPNNNSGNSNNQASVAEQIEEKILRVFDSYPRISPSMLQITLGSSLPTALWKPILESLIERNLIFRFNEIVIGTNGRRNNVTILSNVEPQQPDDLKY